MRVHSQTHCCKKLPSFVRCNKDLSRQQATVRPLTSILYETKGCTCPRVQQMLSGAATLAAAAALSGCLAVFVDAVGGVHAAGTNTITGSCICTAAAAAVGVAGAATATNNSTSALCLTCRPALLLQHQRRQLPKHSRRNVPLHVPPKRAHSSSAVIRPSCSLTPKQRWQDPHNRPTHI